MSIWAIAIISFGLSTPNSSGPHARVESVRPPLSISVLDIDLGDPSKEYCFPTDTDEREGEEESDSHSNSPRVSITHPPLARPISSRSGFAVANRWVLGLGPDARVPYPRC